MYVPLPVWSFPLPLELGASCASSRLNSPNVVEVAVMCLGYSTNLFGGGRVREAQAEAVMTSMAVGRDVTEAAHYDPDLAGE